MKITLLLDKEDIETTVLGKHLQIKTKDNLILNLTPEAYKELFEDIKSLIESKNISI